MFESKDWKTLLGQEDEQRLNEMLKGIAKHRDAYSKAENVKMAQLWCALLEMQKQQAALEERLVRLEDVFRDAGRRMDDRRAVRESLEKF